MNIKVCGMKFQENIEAISALKPDYLGFIFYKNSKRYFEGESIEISTSIKKVGVFVNASFAVIQEKIKRHDLKIIQLHGDESSFFCNELKQFQPEIEIWKAFLVDEKFDFETIRKYENLNAVLLDTKGENYGGNGFKFNWEILKNYNLDQDIILSGGISEDDVLSIKEISETIPKIKTIDINSRFELSPGLKDLNLIKQFINEIRN